MRRILRRIVVYLLLKLLYTYSPDAKEALIFLLEVFDDIL